MHNFIIFTLGMPTTQLGTVHSLYTYFSHICFVIAGLLLAFFCTTNPDNREIDDAGYSGGVLLPSNTEGPGDEVVRTFS